MYFTPKQQEVHDKKQASLSRRFYAYVVASSVAVGLGCSALILKNLDEKKELEAAFSFAAIAFAGAAVYTGRKAYEVNDKKAQFTFNFERTIHSRSANIS